MSHVMTACCGCGHGWYHMAMAAQIINTAATGHPYVLSGEAGDFCDEMAVVIARY